jgi:hypothetical protein
MYKVSQGEKNITVEKDGKSAVIQRMEGGPFSDGTVFISLGALSLYEQSLLIEKNSPVLLIEPAAELLCVLDGLGLKNATIINSYDRKRITAFVDNAGGGKIKILRNKDGYMFNRDFYQGALNAISLALHENRDANKINSLDELKAAFQSSKSEEKEVLELMLLVYAGE